MGQRRIEGLSTALDWLESEEERRDADDDRAVRMAAAARVEAQLRALIAWPADEALELDRIDTSAVTETPGLAEEELLDGLVDRDPDVAEARAEVRRAEARLSRSKLEGVPWLDWVEGGVGSMNGDPIAAEVGIAIDVPIYYWSRTRTREAAADVRAAQLRLADTEARAARRVVTARRTAGASLARWRVEQHHREVLLENSAPLMELADPLLKIELESRMVRAELRVQLAFVDLLAATEVARAAAGL